MRYEGSRDRGIEKQLIRGGAELRKKNRGERAKLNLPEFAGKAAQAQRHPGTWARRERGKNAENRNAESRPS
jgi:hypothetical protein